MLNEEDFFEVFSKVRITVAANDAKSLEIFFKANRDAQSETVDIQQLFDALKMTDRLYRVKETIRAFMDSDEKQDLANKHLLAANYQFEDILRFLRLVKFDLESTKIT